MTLDEKAAWWAAEMAAADQVRNEDCPQCGTPGRVRGGYCYECQTWL